MSRTVMALGLWAVCMGLAHAQDAGLPGPAAGTTDGSLPCAGLPELGVLPPKPQPAGGFSADVNYLLRWFKPVCLTVPVITVGDPADAVPGAIHQPGTRVVVGGEPPHKFEFAATSGVGVRLGWLREDGTLGVEAGGFYLATAAAHQAFVARPDGTPASYLPYQAPDNTEHALPFTVPGTVSGSSYAVGTTQLWGAEANVQVPLVVSRGDSSCVVTVLVGGRYLDLTDRVRAINELHLVADPSASAVGEDQVTTHNQFAGPQVGGTLEGTRGPWSLAGTLKLAAGITHQVHVIEGSPLLGEPNPALGLVPGPLFALPSNAGRATADRVTLVPEVGVRARLAVTSWCSVSLAYSLLYWNKVLCPGDQMDPHVNVTQLPYHGPTTGPAAPTPQFVHTDYFAQGLDLGLQLLF